MDSMSIIGFGRFGAALCGLAERAGWRVRAWDALRPVPAPWGVPGLEDLLELKGPVVLAVPVPALDGTLDRLAPRLGSGHWVMDVGSVKVRPMEALRRHLASTVPWAATHPLFGPASLEAGEARRVVICPGPHPEAEARAQAFWEGLDCEVVRQSAADHDRDMASTHALGFFLAKGLLDAGAGEGVAHPPPSFQALARGVALVRADAGHLFRTLHLENPYARPARRLLLAALQAADRALEEEAAGAPPTGALDIPAPVQEALEDVRDRIDAVDRELLGLLERRGRLALQAAHAKAALGREVRDEAREARLLAARRAWARTRALDPEAVEELFQTLLRHSRALQATSSAPGR